MVIFQLKSVKKKEKGEFTQIFAYSHFLIFLINYKLKEKKGGRWCVNPKENRERRGVGDKKSAFLLKATKPGHKKKAVTTSPVTIVMKLSFCN